MALFSSVGSNHDVDPDQRTKKDTLLLGFNDILATCYGIWNKVFTVFSYIR